MRLLIVMLVALFAISGCGKEENYYQVEGEIISINKEEKSIKLDYGISVEVDDTDVYEEGQQLRVWILDRQDDTLPLFPKVQKIEIVSE